MEYKRKKKTTPSRVPFVAHILWRRGDFKRCATTHRLGNQWQMPIFSFLIVEPSIANFFKQLSKPNCQWIASIWGIWTHSKRKSPNRRKPTDLLGAYVCLCVCVCMYVCVWETKPDMGSLETKASKWRRSKLFGPKIILHWVMISSVILVTFSAFPRIAATRCLWGWLDEEEEEEEEGKEKKERKNKINEKRDAKFSSTCFINATFHFSLLQLQNPPVTVSISCYNIT